MRPRFLVFLATGIQVVGAVALVVNDTTVLAEAYAYIDEVCAENSTRQFCSLVKQRFNDKVEREPIRIAMLGVTGVGKSTLTNTLCGFKSDDATAAPTCKNAECTGAKFIFDPDGGYVPPKAPSLRFIDAPGCNTARYPSDSYIEDVGLDNYDAYMLVLTATRVAVSPCETMLFKWMKESAKPVYLVLNRINEVIDNPDVDEAYSEEEILHLIQESKHFFRRSELEPDPAFTFAVDARFKFRDRYDMPALQDRLIRDVGHLFKMKTGGLVYKHVADRDHQAKMAVHIGAAVAGTISGLTLYPGGSHIPNQLIQILLIFVMANRYELGLNVRSALNVYLNMIADDYARGVAITFATDAVIVVPLFGSAIKGTVAAAATEAMGMKTRQLMREDSSKVIQMAGVKPPNDSWIDFEKMIPIMECMARGLEDGLNSGATYTTTSFSIARCFTSPQHNEL